MARIAGVDLPRDKRGEIAIQYIYGIGTPSARRIFIEARVDASKRVKDWSDDETGRLRDILEREYKVEGDLRREVSMSVKRLMTARTVVSPRSKILSIISASVLVTSAS